MAGEIRFRLDQIKKGLSGPVLAREAHRIFVATTPIKTGNAKRNTKLIGDEVRADYPYAQKLDQGASKQAPDGMTQPTVEYMKKFIQRKAK